MAIYSNPTTYPTFNSFVFDVGSQTPSLIGPSLSAVDNSVVFLPTVTYYQATVAIPVTSFTTPPVSAAQANALSAMGTYWTDISSTGVTVGELVETNAYKLLSSTFAAQQYLSSQYIALTSSFIPSSRFGTGTLSGLSAKQLVGILFNSISGTSTATTTLCAYTNIQFKVHPAYHGSTFALYFSDRSTTLFTVNTATALQTGLTANGFTARGPEELRKRLLGYI
jgi:hypothetical protein